MAKALPTTIYLLRHGQVENPKRVVKERLPGFPLSEVGREEGKEIAQFLARKNISAVYYSPLLRTKQTAQIIAFPSEVKLKACAGLLEVSTSLAGRSAALKKRRAWEFYAKYYEDPRHVLARMRRALKRMVRENPGAAVAAISHGGPIDFLRVHFRGVRDNDIHPAGSFNYGEILILAVDHNLNLLKKPRVAKVVSREKRAA